MFRNLLYQWDVPMPDADTHGGLQGGWGSPVPYDDRVRVCTWRLEQKKINQKINKTLKSLQSTEQDPAATGSSFAQKDSLLLRLMRLTPNIQQAKLNTHLRGTYRQYSVHSTNSVKHITDFFFFDLI